MGKLNVKGKTSLTTRRRKANKNKLRLMKKQEKSNKRISCIKQQKNSSKTDSEKFQKLAVPKQIPPRAILSKKLPALNKRSLIKVQNGMKSFFSITKNIIYNQPPTQLVPACKCKIDCDEKCLNR